jgi:hypothetical protein
MTAGQGGEPQGRPPGGPPPYGPPPGWGPPPQAWGPPAYGPPAAGPGAPGPGYVPPPAGWGPPPDVPEEMERPLAVRAGIAAWTSALLLAVIAVVYTFADLTEVLDDTLEASGTSVADPGFLRTGFIALQVFTLVWCALQGLFLGFAWHGRNWARVVLWVLGGLTVVAGLTGVFSRTYLPGFLQGLDLCQYVLTVAAVSLLAQRSAHAWYRNRRERAAYEGWLRATGQRR